ncbi:YncE family protein [Lysobacter enzymogenes]|uniref:YncE family protein n=1 Tax=Lysobacter enzymogenes TaxID=69 RepID=UPI0038514E80
MYVDIRRGLVFFDRSDRVLGAPPLRRYDPGDGRLYAVPGASDDDVVCDVSRDGRLALRSAEWLAVRGANRSRLGFVSAGQAPSVSERLLSHWSVFDPSGQRALVGTLNGKARPVTMDTATCEVLATMAREVDARNGEIDPDDGRLWVPDPRKADAVLRVDCADASAERVALAVGGAVVRVRFARDGASLLVVGERGTLSRHARDGTTLWSLDFSAIGDTGAGHLFLNQAGTHALLSLPASKRSGWGEDLVVELERGRIEANLLRQPGPPARLAADWFGDRVLSHAGEILDFFSGNIVAELGTQVRAAAAEAA